MQLDSQLLISLSLCVYVTIPIGEAHLRRDALWEKYMWEYAQGHLWGEGYSSCLKDMQEVGSHL